MFIARRPVRECNVCPCIPDLLRAIKLLFLFFDSLPFFAFIYFHFSLTTERSSRTRFSKHQSKFRSTILLKEKKKRRIVDKSTRFPSPDSPTDPNRSIGHSALRLKGDSISASNAFRNISCVSVESSGCVFTHNLDHLCTKFENIYTRFTDIFSYQYCIKNTEENEIKRIYVVFSL